MRLAFTKEDMAAAARLAGRFEKAAGAVDWRNYNGFGGEPAFQPHWRPISAEGEPQRGFWGSMGRSLWGDAQGNSIPKAIIGSGTGNEGGLFKNYASGLFGLGTAALGGNRKEMASEWSNLKNPEMYRRPMRLAQADTEKTRGTLAEYFKRDMGETPWSQREVMRNGQLRPQAVRGRNNNEWEYEGSNGLGLVRDVPYHWLKHWTHNASEAGLLGGKAFHE
jgi:hypothetical protein